MTQTAAYLISLGSEAIVAALIVFAIWRDWRITALAAVSAVLGTLLTHPIVWESGLYLYPRIGYLPGLAVIEAFAVLGEWPVYRLLTRLSWPGTLAISFAANLVSFTLGFV